MSRQAVLALLRGAGGRLCLRRRDRPPTGPEPRRRLEGGGGPAAGRLHRGGPDGTGIPAGGRSRRHDGAGDPPLPGADGRGGPEAHMPGVGGLHQSLCQAAGHGRCGGRHRGDGYTYIYWRAGAAWAGTSSPRRTGHLPHRPAAAGPAAGEALPTDGHGRRGGVPGGGAGVRAEPRPEVAQRPGAGRPEALRHPDGAVPGGGDGPVDHVALGIGVNVLQRPRTSARRSGRWPRPWPRRWAGPLSRPALAAELIRETDRLYAALRSGALEPYLAEYRRRCVNLGRTVRLLSPGGAAGETAEALDIDGDFGLVVRTADGRVRTVRSGEVSVRGMYGYTE